MPGSELNEFPSEGVVVSQHLNQGMCEAILRLLILIENIAE